MAESKIRKQFRVLSEHTAELAGSPTAFAVSLGVFIVWVATGHHFEWSDTHHRVIDMIISLTPFWMVFVLQATQNRDSDIVEAKLDELLKAVKGAREELIGIQRHPETEVDGIR